MLKCKPPFFFWKLLIFKNRKHFLHTLDLSLMSPEISYWSKWKLFFQDWKGLKFFLIKIYNLLLFYIKSGKFSSLFLSTWIIIFSKILSIVMFHLVVAFQWYQIYLISLYFQKVIMARKISAINKKTYFNPF